jgi:hypothetical protein
MTVMFTAPSQHQPHPEQLAGPTFGSPTACAFVIYTFAKGVLLVVCSAGGSSAARSPLAASEAGASGLIRAVHSLKDVTALHGSIEVGLHVRDFPVEFLGEKALRHPRD